MSLLICGSCYQSHGTLNWLRHGLVTNFLLWIECYTVLVATLSTRYPEKMPHFVSYLRTVTRASRNLKAWCGHHMIWRSDARRRIHACWKWGVIYSALYNEAFTGWARLIPRYHFCLAVTYGPKECIFTPEEKQSPVQAAYSSARQQISVQIFRLFNKPSW